MVCVISKMTEYPIWKRMEWLPGYLVCSGDTNVMIHRYHPIWKSPLTGKFYLGDSALNVCLGLSREEEYIPNKPIQIGDPKWPSWRVNPTDNNLLFKGVLTL